MTRRVYFFGEGQSEGDPDRKDILGGKGASLALLTRAGLPVPPGLTISTECCGLFLDAGGKWPEGLADEVRSALARLEQVTGRKFGDAGDPLLVSVRSGAEVSMPGMMDTILNCGRMDEAGSKAPWESLVECIEAVFNSWNSPRAVAYRRNRNICGLPGTSVTVQAMFPSRVSGVVFTTNPNYTAAGEIVVESSYGLGEAVVSGEVDPDNFVLDRETLGIKRRVIGCKARIVEAVGDTSEPDAGAASLSDEQIRRIAEIAMDVEKLFGFPVDVEWGLADGKFALLQARRVRQSKTESTEQLLEELRLALRQEMRDGRGPWVLHNLWETLPHPTPLTWSVQGRFMSGAGGFGAMYKLVGFEPSPAACRQSMIRLIAGRAYMDTKMAPELFFENYPFRYDMDLLRFDPGAAQLPPTLPAATLRARVAAARRIARIDRRLHGMAPKLDVELISRVIPEFVEWRRTEKLRSLESMTDGELVDLWRAREHHVMDCFAPQVLLPSLVSGMALAELRAFLAENFWDADENADELAGILAAPPLPDKTMRANVALFEIVGGKRTLEQWLTDYGHRGADELDLASPRWREQPDEVTAMARRLEGGQDPMELHDAHLREVRSLTIALRGRLGRSDRKQFDRLLDVAKRYIPFREDGKHYLTMGYDLLRDVALEAAERLGIGDDVFFLEVAELCDALTVGTVPFERIAERQARRRTEARIGLSRVIDSEDIEALGRPVEHQAAESYPAYELSAGVASGPARIITSLRDADRLGRGYILVCRSIDPAWTPLFVNAAGVVLECGGVLSHGAVVAREMGIPAVVLPDATNLLRDGQVVAVDGHRGSVGMLDSPSEQADKPADEDDVRIGMELVPPPRARRERIAARRRNISLLVWGAYLLAALLLPAKCLYGPSMALLDALLWPIAVNLGKPAVVAIVAASLAMLTVLIQRFLVDNCRLLETKRRAAMLTDQAAGLRRGSPRRAAIMRHVAPVNVRFLAAAMMPISLLLGPMIMTFLWFPARVAPASWNASPGSAVKVVAAIESGFREPVTLAVTPPARLAESSPATHSLAPVRRTLEEFLETLRQPAADDRDEKTLRDIVGSDRSRKELIASLTAHLEAETPPQRIMWEIGTPEDIADSFAVTVAAGDSQSLRLSIVLGDRRPPAPVRVDGDPTSPIRSAAIVYPPPEIKRILWAPLAWLGNDQWDAGWLLIYLVAYLPVMFTLRWILRTA